LRYKIRGFPDLLTRKLPASRFHSKFFTISPERDFT
jgi:hypothetical protein